MGVGGRGGIRSLHKYRKRKIKLLNEQKNLPKKIVSKSGVVSQLEERNRTFSEKVRNEKLQIN